MDKDFYNQSSATQLGWGPSWFGERHFDDKLVRARMRGPHAGDHPCHGIAKQYAGMRIQSTAVQCGASIAQKCSAES